MVVFDLPGELSAQRHMADPIQKALSRIEELGRISDHPEYLVRTFLSGASKQAARRIIGWMEEAGMRADLSEDGTLRGVFPGAGPEVKPLLLGSHYDTVIDAGKFDGPLGVLSAIAAVEILRNEGIRLPFPVHVLAFSDEEGVRFHSTYLGSKSVAGLLDESALSAKDAAGIPVASAIASDGFKEGVVPVFYQPGEVLGYVELHIEQGRVLESEGLAACAVSGISGQTRLAVKLTGRADHAGTTPMPLRRDALAGAAECILEVEKLAKQNPPLLVTVGRIEVHPGVSNSVPQETVFSVDLRHPEDSARGEFLEKLRARFDSVSAARGLILEWSVIQDGNAVPCHPGLTRQILDVLETRVSAAICLPSGAGHDAVIMSTLGPVAMIFVRCRDGLSHHPDEFATPEDIAIGIEVLVDFMKSFKP